ncbi:threonine/serine exporter ThrE family protein [Kocuria palustris]|uniref:threonine/serine ThrE exporter family protein n=1 Tax=Kocuria palustris TaxID=71999 RepID=UPI0011A00E20|nr:threonine/serine exporter family protein [Kocuria palustris]
MSTREDDAFRLAALLGEALIRGGASSAATTTSLQRVLRSTGMDDAAVGITMGQIIISRPAAGRGGAITHVAEAPPGSLDLELRARVMALIEDLTHGRRTLRECLAEVEGRVDGRVDGAWQDHVPAAAGFSMLGAGFSMIMGGSLATTISAGLIAAAAYAAFLAMERLRSPGIFGLAAVGLTSVLGATAATVLLDDAQTALCIVASLAAWLAGITAYGAAQDIITGWYLSAAGRLMDVASRTAGLVAGVALGIHLMAPFVGESVAYIDALHPDSHHWSLSVLGALGVAGGYGLASRGRGRRLLALAGLGGLAQLLVLLLQAAGLSSYLAILGAAIVIGAVCVRASARLGLPSHASMTIALLPLFPGTHVYQGMLGTLFGVSGTGDELTAGAITAFCLSMGGLLGQFLASRTAPGPAWPRRDVSRSPAPRSERRDLAVDTLQHVRL